MHQHLHSSSCHPHHIKIAIPIQIALRVRRIYSTNVKFKLRINELKTYLLVRGYNNTFLEEQFLRAANIPRANSLQIKPKDSNKEGLCSVSMMPCGNFSWFFPCNLSILDASLASEMSFRLFKRACLTAWSEFVMFHSFSFDWHWIDILSEFFKLLMYN